MAALDLQAVDLVSTHACSLMSRRRTSRGTGSAAAARFNPRLLVDEQATSPRMVLVNVMAFQPTPAR